MSSPETADAPAAAAPPAAPASDPAAAERADALKTEGNAAFKAGRFLAACELYGRAIDECPTAVLHANRAMAEIKLESFGAALEDANQALELDPQYVKAYYRRGSANLALGKFKVALRDFKQVCRIAPRDRSAREKLKACEKAVRQQAFAAAIESEDDGPASSSISVADIVVEPSYSGPHLPEDLAELGDDVFVRELLECYKSQGKLHRKYAIRILLAIKDMMQATSTLMRVPVPEGSHVTVCGDTHGQFYDLCNIFELGGLPSEQTPFLFNGDFVDRGSFSVEVVMTLFAIKLAHPQGLFLTRGNHESLNMNRIYGFTGEVQAKYDTAVMRLFTEVFCTLPLAAVIADKVFVVHGGLPSTDGVTLADIDAIDRFREPPDGGLMSDLMWSDPQPFPGRGPSKRGVGSSFGPDITAAFCEVNGLERVVRSHEVKDEGYLVEHDGKCITIFSAPNYCDQMGNKGAFIRFAADMEPDFVQYTAVPHPPLKPMAYAQGMGSMFGF